MAEKLDGGAVLEAIRDLAARLSTEKQVTNLVDTVKGMQAQNEERWGNVDRRLKAFETKIDELAEADRKARNAIRDEIKEAIDNIEVSVEGGDDTTDPPKWLQPYIPKIQEGVGFLFDKDVGTVLKKKMIKWMTKAEAAGEDE